MFSVKIAEELAKIDPHDKAVILESFRLAEEEANRIVDAGR